MSGCNRGRRRRAASAGTTALETALVLLPFLMLLIGVTDVARYLFTLQSVEYLAVTAARMGVATPSFDLPAPCATVSAASLPFPMPPFLDPATTMCVVQSTGNDNSNLVTVTVTSPFTAYTPFTAAIPGLSGLTSATAITVTTQLSY